MNNVSLVGRITKAPELRCLNEERYYTSFTLAIDRYLGGAYKEEKQSEGKQVADFPRITAWGRVAENLCKYMDKGALVSVVGKVATHRFEKEDGEISYLTDIIAEEIRFLEPASNGKAE